MGRTLRVQAPSIIRAERERRGWLIRAWKERMAHPLKISNLFHFKIPAPIGTRAKVTTYKHGHI